MMSGMGGVDGGRGELVLGGPIGVGDGPSEIKRLIVTKHVIGVAVSVKTLTIPPIYRR